MRDLVAAPRGSLRAFLALRWAGRLIPLALALVIAGQPVGEIVCGVACDSGRVVSQPAPRSRAHPCHDAVDGAAASGQTATVTRDDMRGHEYAGSPCRQSVASLGEDACVWAREICPTLVGQKTTVAPPAVAAVVVAIHHTLEAFPTPPPAEVSRDVTLRIATALRV